MKKIKCIIADDEMLSAAVLADYVARLERYEVAAQCRNGIEVYNVLKTEAVDLLFLDIEMPHLNGLELLRSVKTAPPAILTTAFREYALEGYEFNVIDYLLKPVSFDRFLKAIDKFEGLAPKPAGPAEATSVVPNHFIYVKSSKKMVKVFMKDILFLEGAKEFVKIKTTNGDLKTYQTLQEFEQRLPETQFLRIHRSIIVAVDWIQSCNASYIEVGGVELPIGNSYLQSVRTALNF